MTRPAATNPQPMTGLTQMLTTRPLATKGMPTAAISPLHFLAQLPGPLPPD